MAYGFYYDVVCPYAYLAFSFLHRSNALSSMELRPILLGGLFKEMNVDVNPNSSMAPIKANYIKRDVMRQSEYFSQKLSFHPRHPLKTVDAMRLIHALDQSKRVEISKRLFDAYWHDNQDIDDRPCLAMHARACGIADLDVALQDGKEKLRVATANAFSQNVFGVPTISANGRLYFGGDRLVFLRKELNITLPDAEWQAGAPIDFYFDFSSPYSYLAWAEVKRARMQDVSFNLKPILLGALFREMAINEIPMLSAHPNKTAYYYQDLLDWSAFRGTAFRFSSHFPLRSITALRIALIDENVVDPIYAAAWAHDQNISDDGILRDVLNAAGFDGEKLVQASSANEIKDRLKANTAQAIERGVFGLPTFFVDGEQVFGQDRFPWIKRATQISKNSARRE